MSTLRKHSRKRDAILDCLRSTTCHPTAEWVYSQLKPRIPDLSLGTVYRNLAAFKREGVIDSVGTIGGLERFDARTDTHSHFICQTCGSVVDVDGVELPEPIVEQARRALGARVGGYRLNFYGQCQACNTNPGS